jgi:hypothetical protein
MAARACKGEGGGRREEEDRERDAGSAAERSLHAQVSQLERELQAATEGHARLAAAADDKSKVVAAGVDR